MNKNIKFGLGFLVSALCLWFTFRNFDFHVLFNSLRQGTWIWFLPVLFVFLSSHVVRSLRWKVLLSPIQNIPWSKLFGLLMFGFLMNNVLPARAGELARAYAGNRMTGIKISAFIGSIALERMTDLVGLLFIVMLAFQALPADKLPVVQILRVIGIGVAGALAFLIFVKRYKSRQELESAGFLNRMMGFITNLSQGFLALQSFRKVVILSLASVVIWSFETLGVCLLSRVFHLNLSFVQSAALIVGISMGVMIPAAPGYVGTYEFFAQQTLVLLGFPSDISLSFVLVLHFFQILLSSLLGLPLLLKLGFVTSQESSVPSLKAS